MPFWHFRKKKLERCAFNHLLQLLFSGEKRVRMHVGARRNKEKPAFCSGLPDFS
jgi:hypothetical protein